MQMRPTLLNSCARAATAAEARFRIESPIPSRAARVVALDDGAAEVVRRVSKRQWASSRFYTQGAAVGHGAAGRDNLPAGVSGNGDGLGNGHGHNNGLGPPAGMVSDELALRSMQGVTARLGDELDGADVAVMVATGDDVATVATAIGRSCSVRGIMTAGVILGDGDLARKAISALRPHARVLLVSAEEQDLAELLTALRA